MSAASVVVAELLKILFFLLMPLMTLMIGKCNCQIRDLFHREHMGYIGMCGPKGYGFSAVLLINRVSILAILPQFW